MIGDPRLVAIADSLHHHTAIRESADLAQPPVGCSCRRWNPAVGASWEDHAARDVMARIDGVPDDIESDAERDRQPSERQQKAAARLRVKGDAMLGKATPQWIRDLAEPNDGELDEEAGYEEFAVDPERPTSRYPRTVWAVVRSRTGAVRALYASREAAEVDAVNHDGTNEVDEMEVHARPIFEQMRVVRERKRAAVLEAFRAAYGREPESDEEFVRWQVMRVFDSVERADAATTDGESS